MSTTTTGVLKTYVLLPIMDVNAPIFNRINKDQRVRIDKLPEWRPFLIMTFQGKDGKNVTIRYKQTANSIFQDQQIKDGIPANQSWTTNELRALEFKNGVLITREQMAQKYLDAYPGNELFEGLCPDVPVKIYKEYNKGDELKVSNEDFKLRTRAASKIVDLDLKEAQEMLIRLNGSFFEVPKAIDGKSEEDALIECQDLLVSFLDASEEAGLNAILQDENSPEDKTKVMVGKLLAAKIISFDEGDEISKMSNGQWVKLMDMPKDTERSEKERLFIDFLNSKEGKVHFNDLNNEVKKIDKK